MPEAVDWSKGGIWEWLNTKYDRLICLEDKPHNEQFEALSYQVNIPEWLESNNYDVFIDVGAHVGLFSMVASHHCKHVISYEASPFLYGALRYNMRFLFNVSCNYKYVSKKGVLPIMNDQLSMVGVNITGKPYNIPVVELDEDLLSSAWLSPMYKIFIKMDIEGSELNALQGASKLIQMPNVDWIIDAHTWVGITTEQVQAFFPHRKTRVLENVIEVK